MTEKPLNKFFGLITTLLPYLVLAVSIIASVVDLIRSEVLKTASNREFRFTCFMMDMVDVVLLTLNAFIHRTAWYKKKTEEQQQAFEKRQQLIDNVLAEVLLYPTVLCSLISVTTDRVFEDFENGSKIGYDQHVVCYLHSLEIVINFS